jgi:hypothetical protein
VTTGLRRPTRDVQRAALAIALAWLGCSSPAAPHETTVLAKVPERIVVLPLNVATPMPAELKEHGPAVWSTLETALRSHGSQLKTLAAPTARGLWLASVRAAQAEPKDSQRKLEDAVAHQFATRLRESAEFDALIFPSLFLQRAVLEGTTATWDGTERTLEFDAGPRGQPPPDIALEGAVPAASLHVVVFDANGTKLHEKQAGLTLLVRARISDTSDPVSAPSFAFVPRRDAFADATMLLEGVEAALDPFVPARHHTENDPKKRRR